MADTKNRFSLDDMVLNSTSDSMFMRGLRGFVQGYRELDDKINQTVADLVSRVVRPPASTPPPISSTAVRLHNQNNLSWPGSELPSYLNRDGPRGATSPGQADAPVWQLPPILQGLGQPEWAAREASRPAMWDPNARQPVEFRYTWDEPRDSSDVGPNDFVLFGDGQGMRRDPRQAPQSSPADRGGATIARGQAAVDFARGLVQSQSGLNASSGASRLLNNRARNMAQ